MQQHTRHSALRWLGIPLLALLLAGNACKDEENATTSAGSASIGPAGGTLRSADGRLTLRFPAGALTEPRTIIITRVSNTEAEAALPTADVDGAWLLQPAGLQFQQPVRAEILIAEQPTDDNVPQFLLFSDSAGELELLDNQQMQANLADRRIIASADLQHFSTVHAVGRVSVNGGAPKEFGRVSLKLPNSVEVGQPFTVAVEAEESQDLIFSSVDYQLTTSNITLASGISTTGMLPVVDEGDEEFGTLYRLNAAGSTCDSEPSGTVTANYTVNITAELASFSGRIGTLILQRRMLQNPIVAATSLTNRVTCTAPASGGGTEVGSALPTLQNGTFGLAGGRISLGPDGIQSIRLNVDFTNDFDTGEAKGSYKSLISFANLEPERLLMAYSLRNGYGIMDIASGERLYGFSDDEDGRDTDTNYFGGAIATQAPGGPTSDAIIWPYGISVGSGFPTSGFRQPYLGDEMEYSNFVQLESGTTFDVSNVGGFEISAGLTYTKPDIGIGYVDYNSNSGLYEEDNDQILPASDFGSGQLVSAYRHQIGGLTLAVTRGSTDNRLYVHHNNDQPATAIGELGFDTRKLRCWVPYCVSTHFGFDGFAAGGLDLIHWDGSSTLPVIDKRIPLGSVENAAGIISVDGIYDDNDVLGLVAAGFRSQMVYEVAISADGNILAEVNQPVPTGCVDPGHAAYQVDATGLKIVGSCNGSDNFFIIDSILTY